MFERRDGVLVVPGLKKAAFVFGGEYGKGLMDVQLKAEILSYSRTQGLFAGINLSGGVLRGDEDDNKDLYGSSVAPRDVLLTGSVPTPTVAGPFMKALRRGI